MMSNVYFELKTLYKIGLKLVCNSSWTTVLVHSKLRHKKHFIATHPPAIVPYVQKAMLCNPVPKWINMQLPAEVVSETWQLIKQEYSAFGKAVEKLNMLNIQLCCTALKYPFHFPSAAESLQLILTANIPAIRSDS